MNTDDLRKLTNSYRDVRLYNLHLDSDGEGPYAIWQRGYPPRSQTFKVQSFLLNKKGQWETVWRWVSVSEEEKTECLFDSVAEVIAMLDRIGVQEVDAIVDLPPGVTEDQARRDFKEGSVRLIRRFRDAQSMPVER